MCIYIARSLGFSFTDITRFGLGALISDIGMANFPSSLISRPSGFSYKEKEEIQKHPLYSVEFCKKIGIEDILIETLIMQHHERFDGSGYPYGLKGDEIHPISRLFTITDVYIAMTSNRPHRAGFPPHMVLGDILRLSGTLFDPKMSEIFIRQIGVFPIGNMVELTSGHYALVASPNKHDPLRPIVILFTTKKKLSTPERLKSGNDTLVTISRGQRELIDLSKDEKYGKIKRGVDHRKFRINPDNYFDKI
jgi:HD-GYP domain-containing protein (c-di-GMP phosphodiesterase class II)